jgi:hypothetical protein
MSAAGAGAGNSSPAAAAAALDQVAAAPQPTASRTTDAKNAPPVAVPVDTPLYRVAVYGEPGSGKSYRIAKWVARAKELGLKLFRGGEFEFPVETFTRSNPFGNAEWNTIMRTEGAQLMYASFSGNAPMSISKLFDEMWGVTLNADGSRNWTLLKGKANAARPVDD